MRATVVVRRCPLDTVLEVVRSPAGIDRLLRLRGVEIVDGIQLVDGVLEIHLNGFKQASCWVEDNAMNDRGNVRHNSLLGCCKTLTLNHSSLKQVETLFNHVQLHKSTMSSLGILNGVELLAMRAVPLVEERYYKGR